jgi:hypothetical protein
MQLQVIQKRIYEIRGQKVMLDFDLAELYETETKVLKQAVRRNLNRFPSDFMFELTRDEYNFLKSQIVTLESLRSQFVTSNKRGGTRYLPFAFTEQGVAMLASVLNSPKAIQVNISIVRAFVMLRQLALTYKELAEKIGKLERKYNKKFADVYDALDLLLQEKENTDDWKGRKPIGYKK